MYVWESALRQVHVPICLLYNYKQWQNPEIPKLSRNSAFAIAVKKSGAKIIEPFPSYAEAIMWVSSTINTKLSAIEVGSPPGTRMIMRDKVKINYLLAKWRMMYYRFAGGNMTYTYTSTRSSSNDFYILCSTVLRNYQLGLRSTSRFKVKSGPVAFD